MPTVDLDVDATSVIDVVNHDAVDVDPVVNDEAVDVDSVLDEAVDIDLTTAACC